MQMKLKSLFLDTESFLKCFLRTQGISFEQYQYDMTTLQHNACDLLDLCHNRMVSGIDIYPYVYVLDKIRKSKPLDLKNFIRYFTVMYNKQSDEKIPNHLAGIMNIMSNEKLVLFLIATMQYYFL